MGRRTFLRRGSAGVAAIACSGLPGARLWAQTAGSLGVRGVYSAPGLSYASLHVANRKGIIKKNGLDADLKAVSGGHLAMVSLTSQEADFACVAAIDPIMAWDKGLRFQVIAVFLGAVAAQLTARKEWMDQNGVSPGSPVQEKVRALKNARIGSATVGGGPAQYTKYLGRSYGLDPERDISIISVGQGASRIAALREGRIDLTVGGSPEADEMSLQGFGELFLNFATEAPVFGNFPYTVLAVTQELANRQPEKCRRIAQSIGEANDLIHSHLGEAIDLLKAHYPRIDPRAIERAMQRDQAAFPRGARMSPAMWRNGFEMARSMQTVKNVPPLEEGQFWTNKFLK